MLLEMYRALFHLAGMPVTIRQPTERQVGRQTSSWVDRHIMNIPKNRIRNTFFIFQHRTFRPGETLRLWPINLTRTELVRYKKN